MKIDRLLSIIIMLINRPLVTARELSEKYEVTIRTIYRDIETISAAGIPVVAYQGKKGGFCLMQNYRIDRQFLSLTDMASILMALKGINSSIRNTEIEGTIEKIESLVPDEKWRQVEKYNESVIIDLSPWGTNNENKKNIQILHNSILNNKLVSFRYRNLLGEESQRIIEPISLIMKGYCWYIYGFCRNKNDYRLFRVSRMHNCIALNESFEKKIKPFNESEFFETNKREKIKISLKFSPLAAGRVNEFFYESIKEITNDGYYIIEVEFPEDEWVYSTILSYGNDVEVLSPPHLREVIKTRLQKSITLYKKDTENPEKNDRNSINLTTLG